jgi:ligand-binding SRPBCC domain-containing protein
MSTVHRLKAVQKIPVDLKTAWKYFSDPRNLLSITPSSLNLKMTSEVFNDEVYAGQVMTYKLKPLFGISFEWMTEITHVERMKMFIDEQHKGPYKQWHHQHHFKAIQAGVEMTDLIDYRLPFGMIGNMMHGILVRPRLEEIFAYRFEKVNEYLGTWPGQKIDILID